MEKTLVDADIKPYFDKSADTPTGTCAAVVKGKERALCANIAASAKYTMEHLTENWVRKINSVSNFYKFCLGCPRKRQIRLPHWFLH